MADIFKIPLSDSNIYSQILPTLVSIINKKSIKRKFSGSGCVMIPGFNVEQYFKLNGTEYTYTAEVAAGTAGKINKGWYAKTPTAPTDKNQETKPDFANLDAIKEAVKKGATVQNGTKSITGMNDTANPKDGVSDTDATVISKNKAYELASKELLKANQIGDTKGNAGVFC